MKNLMMLMMVLFVGLSQAQAAEVPNCWKESGKDIEDGDFMVGIDASKISKEQLLVVLRALQGQHINAANYPLIFSQHIWVLVKAVDYGVGSTKLSRAQLIAAVNQELGALMAQTPGMMAECNGHVYPQPGFGVHN